MTPASMKEGIDHGQDGSARCRSEQRRCQWRDGLNGQTGNDILDGGDGRDTAQYGMATGAVVVDLVAGTASGADGDDTLISIENVQGSPFDDVVWGDANDNLIDGVAGADTLNGGEGNDTLWGNHGADVLNGGDGDDESSEFFAYGDLGYTDDAVDTMTGGAGRDRFIFQEVNLLKVADVITDFETNADAIDLAAVLRSLDDAQAALDGGYIVLTQSGDDTVVSVDVDGFGTGQEASACCTLLGVAAEDLSASNFVV